ncbi:TPM domain-containing protein [Lysinibacillus sp. LZ02]|uniref:TPM domain-containing protein n=1 Tax=Lysinibacillus sp. LZ02 TaxID=3420668 RepID=UPI003D36A1BF
MKFHFILTVPTIGDLEAYEYGVEVFREWGIGDAEKDNGMLIFVTTSQGEGNNKVRIATGYGLEWDYPDGKTGEMLDTYMVPALKEGDYTKAFAQVVEAIRAEENIEHTWQQSDVFVEEVHWLYEVIGAVLFGGIMLAVLSVICWIAWGIMKWMFRKIQGTFYWFYQKLTGQDIRSEGYKAYLAAKAAEAAAWEAERETRRSSDSNYDYGSSDSYSGGGGGSDRNF